MDESSPKIQTEFQNVMVYKLITLTNACSFSTICDSLFHNLYSSNIPTIPIINDSKFIIKN